ncbi:MAG: PDGLE domain-containing protein [Chloroflexota bacterium]
MKIKWWLIALLACLAVASLSPLASSAPDGLERVAENQGFLVQARQSPFQIIADYVFPGIANETLATLLAGYLGTIILFAITYGLARLVKRRQPSP